MEGTKMPAGTLQPYEITTRPVRITVASKSEKEMRHCAEVLARGKPAVNISLTEV
jgi:hypothetical protein